MTEVINIMILHLVLKKKWYGMQWSGEKPEEYRDITPYWYQRLYQRKDEYGHAGPLTRDDAEYCCDPALRYILKGEGFADTELRPYTHVCFHCGYTSQCFIHRIDGITIGRGRPEWGAPEDRDVFIIRHHREPRFSPDGFKFNIGDIIKVSEPFENLFAPGSNKGYHDNLRVIFRFYDGHHVYVVEAEDGIDLIIPEHQAELVERSTAPATPPDNAPENTNSRLLDENTYQALRRLGILDTSVRSYNRGTSDYSRHIIQPWAIWQDYNLNPWDADIVKRILRTKQGDSRRLDYEKIIHICEERIRQIDTED